MKVLSRKDIAPSFEDTLLSGTWISRDSLCGRGHDGLECRGTLARLDYTVLNCITPYPSCLGYKLKRGRASLLYTVTA